MKVIGLTGGIGSGKTTVCKIFESLDVPVFYADVEGKRLLAENAGVRAKVKSLFGDQVYLHDGQPDRKKIAEVVFNHPDLLKKLNAIIHPAVRQSAREWVEQNEDSPYGIQEIAILFESGAWRSMDGIITVWAPEDLRILRVVKRDGVDEESVRARMTNQISDDLRLSLSDFVILNIEENGLDEQVKRIHLSLMESEQGQVLPT